MQNPGILRRIPAFPRAQLCARWSVSPHSTAVGLVSARRTSSRTDRQVIDYRSIIDLSIGPLGKAAATLQRTYFAPPTSTLISKVPSVSRCGHLAAGNRRKRVSNKSIIDYRPKTTPDSCSATPTYITKVPLASPSRPVFGPKRAARKRPRLSSRHRPQSRMTAYA